MHAKVCQELCFVVGAEYFFILLKGNRIILGILHFIIIFMIV
jgi:hypothetical protein